MLGGTIRIVSRLGILAIALASAACGGGSSAAGPNGPTAAPSCPVTMEGPFARTMQLARPLPARGGVVADGTYELTVMGVDKVDPRPGQIVEDLRWHITFTTDQRDARHQEGAVSMAFGVPPQVQCGVGRFAVVGNVLRFATPMRGLSEVAFSVTPDGFVIDSPDGGSLDVKSFAFRRR